MTTEGLRPPRYRKLTQMKDGYDRTATFKEIEKDKWIYIGKMDRDHAVKTSHWILNISEPCFKITGNLCEGTSFSHSYYKTKSQLAQGEWNNYVQSLGWDEEAEDYHHYHNQPKPTKESETTRMNYSTAVMLFNENIRAIKVEYEPSTNPKVPSQRYTFKTLDKSIEVGDFVVVPTETRHNMTVVKVMEVDVEVDFESSTEIKWIVDKVNTVNNTNILAEEIKWIDAIKKSEIRKKKEDIKKNMMDYLQDVDFNKLSITHVTDVVDSTPSV